MNNKYLILAGIIAVVVLGLGFFFLGNSSKLGGVSPYYAMNNQALTNELNAIAAPLVGWNKVTTGSLAWPALATSTAAYQESTTTAVTSTVGDYIEIAPLTPTAYINYTAYVSATNVVTITAINGSTTTITPASTTFNIVDIPASSFVSPAIL